MKFSIILPCYNVEKYIRVCIDSILQQTYKDFEVILVDDGAKDSTPRICDEYAEKDARVKVIHKPNGGQADARNVGLEAAQGDYICYMDSDDLLANDNVLQLLADKAGIRILFTTNFKSGSNRMDISHHAVSTIAFRPKDGLSLIFIVISSIKMHITTAHGAKSSAETS
jgi:glycosyltransferase involved in cell wall biosynthesis